MNVIFILFLLKSHISMCILLINQNKQKKYHAIYLLTFFNSLFS